MKGCLMFKIDRAFSPLKAGKLFLVLLLSFALMVLPSGAAFANPASDSTDKVGNLTVMVNFDPETEGVEGGHSYLLFTSYKDGLTLEFEDLYGYYEIDEDFYKAAQKDEKLWSFESGNNADEVYKYTRGELKPADVYNRFRSTPYSCQLDAGEFITIGDYTMVAQELGVDDNRELARMISDAVNQSDLSDNFFAATRGYFGIGITQGVFLTDIFSSLTKLCWEQNPLEGDVIGKLISSAKNFLGLSHTSTANNYEGVARMVDGDTMGGLFVNREMWRQKSWQSMYPNKGYSVDVTQKQLDDLLKYLNTEQNHYSFLAHNCSYVCSNAWNAALGFMRDGEGERTDQRSPLYIDAKDTTYEMLSGLFETPKKLYETISEWGPERGGKLVEFPILHGVKVPQ